MGPVHDDEVPARAKQAPWRPIRHATLGSRSLVVVAWTGSSGKEGLEITFGRLPRGREAAERFAHLLLGSAPIKA